MTIANTISWFLFFVIVIYILVHYRKELLALLKDKLEFQKEVNKVMKQSYREERLNQARELGKQKARPQKPENKSFSEIEKLVKER